MSTLNSEVSDVPAESRSTRSGGHSEKPSAEIAEAEPDTGTAHGGPADTAAAQPDTTASDTHQESSANGTAASETPDAEPADNGTADARRPDNEPSDAKPADSGTADARRSESEPAASEPADTAPADNGPGTQAAHPEPSSASPTDGEADGKAPNSQTGNEAAGATATGRRADRGAFVIAGVAVAACAGLVLYGVLGQDSEPKHRAVPTAEVTYEVEGTGTVDISYRADDTTGTAGKAATATKVQLPWKKSVKVALGKEPIVSIVLGEKGGQARCTLAIRGRYVQSATATGKFGRATCSGSLPAQDPR